MFSSPPSSKSRKPLSSQLRLRRTLYLFFQSLLIFTISENTFIPVVNAERSRKVYQCTPDECVETSSIIQRKSFGYFPSIMIIELVGWTSNLLITHILPILSPSNVFQQYSRNQNHHPAYDPQPPPWNLHLYFIRIGIPPITRCLGIDLRDPDEWSRVRGSQWEWGLVFIVGSSGGG
jgi:hypothetical protein